MYYVVRFCSDNTVNLHYNDSICSQTLSLPYFRLHLSSVDFFFIIFDFFNKLSLGKKFIAKLMKDRMSNSVDPDETDYTVSSGSMLFAKTYYYRLWQ